MALIDLIDTDVIKVPLEATGKVDVIKELVGILDDAGRIRDRERIEDALLERENQGSTGLENGIAVPHAKTEAVDSIVVALGISPKGVDFGAMDGKPSHIFFLMLAPRNQPGKHVETLSEIARLTQSAAVRDFLLGVKSADEVVEFFKEE
jgi:fructose-specific phosphotransferase system IIA component